MCLAIPGIVVEVDGNVAVADFWGVRKRVRLDIVDAEVRPGDYVLTHVGYAIKRVPQKEAEETLRIFEEFIGERKEGGT